MSYPPGTATLQKITYYEYNLFQNISTGKLKEYRSSSGTEKIYDLPGTLLNSPF